MWLEEINEENGYTKRLFDLKECPHCGIKFNVISKYQWNSPGGGNDYCSHECYEMAKIERDEKQMWDMNLYKTMPTIYKITNKTNNKCYIGQTIQPFTLRWYQHFFQASDNKFHKEIKANKIEDWTFEIIEKNNLVR